MARSGESPPDDGESEGAFDEFLSDRMRVFLGFPESDFYALMSRYAEGRERLHHFFEVDFSGEGLVALPKGGTDFPPARFPVRSCLSKVALDLV